MPIAAVAADRAEPGLGRAIVTSAGDATAPVVVGDTLFYVGAEFEGLDFAGRTPGLWAVPYAGGTPRRLTDPETIHVHGDVGEPSAWHDAMLVAILDRGAVSLRAVPMDADRAALSSLPAVLGGRRVVTSFRVSREQVAAVVADPSSCGDVVIGDIGSLIAAEDSTADEGTDGAGAAHRLTEVSAPLRAAGISAPIEITGSAPDGYPVHGWLVLPPDEFAAPHPVLLNVHGGPHSAYGWAVFDEAQMYAAHGYAAVLPDPRGSAGCGQAHGRALLGELGVKDVDDILALLDAALARNDLDAGRVGVMGGSYGGFMASWLASHAPGRFLAGVSERRERLGLADRDVGYRLFLRGVLRGLGPGGSAREVAAGVRRPHRDPAAHRPFGTGLAMSDRAGPAPVRGAEIPWTRGRDAAIPRGGTRAIPIRQAEAPRRAVRGHPRLVVALHTGALNRYGSATGTDPGEIRLTEHRRPGKVSLALP